MSAHVESHSAEHSGGGTRLYLFVWFWLLGLTMVEVVAAYQQLAIKVMLVILLGLSIIKAALIMSYFMHLRFERLRLVVTLIPALLICIGLFFAFFPDSWRLMELRPR